MIRDETGRIDDVRYDELAPLLLKQNRDLQRELVSQQRAADAMAEQLDSRLQRLEQH